MTVEGGSRMDASSLCRVATGEASAGAELGAGANAATLAERGWLYRAGGLALALRMLHPPDVAVPTLRVLACHDQLLTPGRWPALEAALDERFGAERLQLRSSLPPERLEPLGLRVFQHFIVKQARASEAEGVELVAATWPDDHDYVADLMCASLRNGMPQAGLTDEQLAVYVQGHLRLGQPGGSDAVIAYVDGAQVGTAVFRVEDDELTADATTRLVDIMTSERGHGHGWRIAPAFESYVARATGLPRRVVGTVVGEADGSDRATVERLSRAGWALDHTWWTPAV